MLAYWSSVSFPGYGHGTSQCTRYSTQYLHPCPSLRETGHFHQHLGTAFCEVWSYCNCVHWEGGQMLKYVYIKQLPRLYEPHLFSRLIQSPTARTTQGQYWYIQTTLALPKVFSVPLRLSAAIEAGVHRRERGKQRPLWKTETQVPARAHARCRAEKEGGSSLHCLQVKFKYLRVVKIKNPPKWVLRLSGAQEGGCCVRS